MSPFPNPPKTVGKLLSCRAASIILDCSDDTVRKMAREGRLEAVIVGRQSIRVTESSVAALAKGGDQ